ncbi:MAG TPA: MBL fold metallo-hydrolase [Spirochaetota bacterium]|jgi:metallo-beta-lactamase family protein|nr:MAG: Ribonuclease [Spirochaetes bacterium ADurb.Bin133]HNZ27684.1 MBL fold metallo-hydrolase [Spirochaetota bacterium]HOS33918.1 MBL fold metallo-hydrolase [Spirochaetota bacterium]HOS56922.1 MBL fold metallo-hydrolase [Spirochaetota bacterium]HPY88781.1 MBL fold metallo-hydrolase [Spirochaetota bacterium]
MRLTFYGAAGCVTGSNFLLETGDKRMLIECGMFQETKLLRERNYKDFPYNAFEIDAVFITHSHIDHTGLLPKLIKEGYCAPIFLTDTTKEITEVLLYDSAHIQEMDLEWKNKKRRRSGLPEYELIYSAKDVDETLKLFQGIPYNKEVEIFDNVSVVFKESGHIMGSAYLEFFIKENGVTKKIIFTGDLGHSGQAIINDPETSNKADIIVIESTYGNRLHKSREKTNLEIKGIIEQVIKTNGSMIIPSFALGRTQEMIYRLFKIFEDYDLPLINVYVDSPMAQKITEIYARNKDLYDEEAKNYLSLGKNPLEMDNLRFTSTKEESIAINYDETPKIIISSSGMCEAGRILHHLKHNIWNENSHILFVGYQAAETLGRRVIEGAKEVKIFGEIIKVKARIHTIGGLSAHADRDELLGWLSNYKKANPEVFLVHGDVDVMSEFSNFIKYNLGFNVYTPRINDVVDFSFDKKTLAITNHNIEKETNNIDKEYEYFLSLANKIKEEVQKSYSGSDNKKRIVEKFLKRINSNIDYNVRDLASKKD